MSQIAGNIQGKETENFRKSCTKRNFSVERLLGKVVWFNNGSVFIIF